MIMRFLRLVNPMFRYRTLNVSDKVIFALIFLYAIFAGILILQSDLTQIGDFEAYSRRITFCLANNTFYPNRTNVFDNFINNPGAVNIYIFLSRLLKLSSVRDLLWLNLIFQILSLALIQLIIIKNPSSSRLFITILWLLYIPNYSHILYVNSELIFNFLFILLLFFLTRVQYDLAGLSIYCVGGLGFFISVLDYIRPIGFLVLFALIFVRLVIHLSCERRTKACLFLHISFLLFGYGLSKFTLKELSEANTGVPNSGSIIFGYNMLMANGPDGNGTWESGTFTPNGVGYFVGIESTKTEVKDKFWIEKSLNYISNDFKRFILLGCNKLLYTYSYDVFSMNKLDRTGKWKTDSQMLLDYLNEPRIDFFSLLIVFNNVVYYIIFILFLFWLYSSLKSNRNNAFWFGLVFFFLYTGAIFVFIGGARYHFVLVNFMLIMFSTSSQEFIIKCRQRFFSEKVR